jgi:hypothetical protein
MALPAIVACNKDRSVYSATAARHRAFAARFHGTRRGDRRASPVERVMRRAHPGRFYRTALRVHLALAAITRTIVQRYAIRSIGQGMLRAGPRQILIRPIGRLMSRSTRVIAYREVAPARTVAPQVARRGRIERSMVFPVAVMTLVRERAPAALQPIATERAEVPHQMTAPSARAAAAMHPTDKAGFTLPFQELSRVTDHVIQQLDRRTLSYRERMGRV